MEYRRFFFSCLHHVLCDHWLFQRVSCNICSKIFTRRRSTDQNIWPQGSDWASIQVTKSYTGEVTVLCKISRKWELSNFVNISIGNSDNYTCRMLEYQILKVWPDYILLSDHLQIIILIYLKLIMDSSKMEGGQVHFIKLPR